jgi:enamine deaminase RidA (YjgF/YER057c/UK114 family)
VSEVEKRLREAGWELPQLRAPIGIYHGAMQTGNLLYLSGHGPIKDDERVFIGKVGKDLTVEEAQQAAELVTINALRTIKEAVGDLDRVERVVKLLGFVHSAPGFGDQPKVIDAASRLLVTAFGEKGEHARTAVGMSELPFGISVEIEMILEIASS